ncbi:unnamed protein product [Moneuplotes crassus]|uniref:Uncharacterized protein n=1 Tax=Euplotes crassus TaxID=5936 RepID=A0AAD1U6M4_EUPCR|nr:unnamed protein product [Moneuplotes crassus]
MSKDNFEFDFEDDQDLEELGKINIQSEGNPFGQENVYYEGAEKAAIREMQEIEEVDEGTAKQTTNSQKTDSANRYMSKENSQNKQSIGFHPSLNEYDATEIIDKKPSHAHNSRFVGRHGSLSKPKFGNQSFGVGNKPKNMNQEDLISEITELKKSNRKDLDEIKRLKSEQMKIENLYRRYKEQENDIFTAERILTQNDEIRVFNKTNLMPEVNKIKKMLMNKIKSGKPKTSFMSKRVKSSHKGQAKTTKNTNLVCRSCKMMSHHKSDNERFITGAPEDGVTKTIVRIQIKKLKELKASLEEDLSQKEAELGKLRKNNAPETEKSVEKELKKSLNILRGLRKKFVKLSQENGSAYEQDIDPIVKSIDKELNKSRKWRNDDISAVKDQSKHEEVKESIKEEAQEPEEQVMCGKEIENFDTTQDEKELQKKLEELEKELALSDEEFEKRLIDRLKKEIKTSKHKIEKGLKKEYITKQKQIYKSKDEEIRRLQKENDELSSHISRIKILLS